MEIQKSNIEAKDNNMELKLLNPMAFYPGFPHIAELIFKEMDKKSLKVCRLLSKSWQEYIDDRNLLWKKIMEYEDPNRAFQSACNNGHFKMAEFLIQKSTELNIDLNANDETFGRGTAFHLACHIGNSNIAEMLVQKSADFNIDLNALDGVSCKTAFHLACESGNLNIVEMIIHNSAEFSIDLNAKDGYYGRTAFHLACETGNSNIAEMLVQKSAEFSIDLNAKDGYYGRTAFQYDRYGRTAFHSACIKGKTKIIEMMMDNAEYIKIDFTSKDNDGKTGFQHARHYLRTDVVNLIKNKMPWIAIN